MVTLRTYAQTVEAIRKSNSDIVPFEPDDGGLEKYLQEQYDFFNETYTRQSELSYFKAKPVYLYYFESLDLNACAGPINIGYSVVVSTRLLFVWGNWTNNFDESNRKILEDWLGDTAFFDNDPLLIMRQFCSLYTMYHEYAHVLQFAYGFFSSDSIRMVENPKGKQPYRLINHLAEVDADAFAAICIGDHINKYIHRTTVSNPSKQQASTILKTAYLATVCYLFQFQSAKREVYLREGTHPHWSIRLMNIISAYVGYVNETWNLNIDGGRFSEVFDGAFEISQLIFPNLHAPKDAAEFASLFSDIGVPATNEYMQQLNIKLSEIENTAVQVRNKSIRDQSGQ